MTDYTDLRIEHLKDVWMDLLKNPHRQNLDFLTKALAYGEAIVWMAKEELLIREELEN